MTGKEDYMLALKVTPGVVSILASQNQTNLKLINRFLKGHKTVSLVLQGTGSCRLLIRVYISPFITKVTALRSCSSSQLLRCYENNQANFHSRSLTT